MPKKLTNEEVIARFKAVHNDRYDYSLVEYVNSKSNLRIICKEHGEFLQSFSNHSRGQNCPKCSSIQITKEDFIKKSIAKHGDKYDYSKVNYINNVTKVIITCPVHGDFEQIPTNHMRGSICYQCSRENSRLSQNEVIQRFKHKHSDRYNYSKVIYKRMDERVTIICRLHGEFEQSPNDHLKTNGCPRCAGRNKTTQEVVEQLKAVWGDKYDYSKVVYQGSKAPLTIICKEHGEFEQTIDVHIKGHGCARCSGNARKTTEEIIKEFKTVHNDRYNYSKVKYNGANKPVTIICNKHGDFKQSPTVHLKKHGCPECGHEQVIKQIRYTTDEFIRKARAVHGDRYDYSKVDYKGAFEKLIIICREHGEFKQTASAHLMSKGCQVCGGSNKLTTEEFIQKAREVHGNKYDYSKVNYYNNNTKIIIICPEHGEFKQTPGSHLNNNGCNSCAEYGFNPQKPAILYYLKINGGQAYKIGITNRTVEDRFSTYDLGKIEIVTTFKYENGSDCYADEQEFLSLYKEFKYKGEPLLKNGNTELFNKDVLELDNI